MSSARDRQLSMVERMERALLMLAHFIELDGDVHVLMYEKFEAELKELKARQDPSSRRRVRSVTRQNGSHSYSRATQPFLTPAWNSKKPVDYR
jgi:hypothetical protein